MSYTEILSFVGPVIGAAGFVYALYQGTQRRKLEKFIRSQAWYTYAKANNVTGIVQLAFEKYKTTHVANLDSAIVELLAKSDAFGQDLFKETIRQIQLAEPTFDATSINRWIAEGKLGDSHKHLFLQLAIEAPRKQRASTNA